MFKALFNKLLNKQKKTDTNTQTPPDNTIDQVINHNFKTHYNNLISNGIITNISQLSSYIIAHHNNIKNILSKF